jgi:O-antigen ligase
MSIAVVALGYAWIAQIIAFAVTPWSIPPSVRIRALALWSAAAAIIFLVREPIGALAAAGIIMALLAPTAARDRAGFFIICVPAVPTTLTAPLPFPGLNQLLDFSFYMVASVVLLLPMLLMKRHPTQNAIKFSWPDLFLILFISYTAVVIGLALGLSGGMRAIVSQTLFLAVPYFLIRFAIGTIDDFEAVFQAVLLTAIVLGAIAFVSALKQWDFYALARPASIYAEFRSGYLRLNATVNNNSLAFHLTAGLMALEFLKRRRHINWITVNGLRAFLAFGILMCDSRGAIAATGVALGTFAILTLKNRPLRLAAMASTIPAAIMAIVWLTQSDFTYISQDSFTYRQNLLRTSLAYAAQHPIFGDYLFYRSGQFNHLIQGEGIIDVANFYLQIVLLYGLVGVVLFFPALIVPLAVLIAGVLGIGRNSAREPLERNFRARRALRGAQRSDAVSPDDTKTWWAASSAIIGLLLGWLFLVATTSDVALTLHLGIVMGAIGRSLADMKPVAQPAIMSERTEQMKQWHPSRG